MGLENPTHWIPIIVVLLLVFGARRLPEIGRSLGEGMRGFRDSLTGQNQQPEKLNAGEQAPAPQATQATPAAAPPTPTPAQQAPAPQAPPTAEPPAAAS